MAERGSEESAGSERAREESAGSGRASRRADLVRRRRARLAGAVLAVAALVAVAVVAAVTEPEPAPPPQGGAPPVLPEGCDEVTGRAPEPELPDEPPLAQPPPGDLVAVVETSCGSFEIDLAEDAAPLNVANFVGLANEGFYDGLRFHRVEKDSVLQAGDPNERNLDPPDGPNYTVPDELPDRPREYVYGVVGMANAGADTAGSQFFVVVHDYDGALEGAPEPAGYPRAYSIIGRVERASWETLQRIGRIEPKGGNDPVRAVEPALPIAIDSIEILTR